MAQAATTRSQESNYEIIKNRKIDFATAGLRPFIYKDITQNVSPENALKISEYILAMKSEIYFRSL